MCKSLGETVNQIHVLNGEIFVPKNNVIIQVYIEPWMEDVEKNKFACLFDEKAGCLFWK